MRHWCCWQEQFQCHVTHTENVQTVFVLPSGFGRRDVVDHLLQTGANVHARDDGGLIPLHNACSFGHSEVRLCTPLHPSERCSYFSDYKFPRSSSLVSRRRDF